MQIIILILSCTLCSVFCFLAGSKFGQRTMRNKVIAAAIKAQHDNIPEVKLDKNNKFILNGQEYELMEEHTYSHEDDIDEDEYEIVELPEFDSFGVPVYDKKDRKPN